MTNDDAAPASPRLRRGIIAGAVIAEIATINAYFRDGWDAALVTAVVCLVAVVLVVGLVRTSMR